jgi:hypothetical protein
MKHGQTAVEMPQRRSGAGAKIGIRREHAFFGRTKQGCQIHGLARTRVAEQAQPKPAHGRVLVVKRHVLQRRPTGTQTTATRQPEFRFTSTDYWAQGLNLGLDLRF